MKRSICFLLFCSAVLWVSSIPVKKYAWQTIRLVDGTLVEVMPKGDEYLHYMEAADGTKYIYDNAAAAFRRADDGQLLTRGAAKRAAANARRSARNRVPLGAVHAPYTGEKKVLLLLVQFTNKKFDASHDLNLYRRIANEEGFSHSLGFKGSIRDYFRDQSGGQFLLHFDVKGPIDLSHPYAYYGANTASGDDIRPDQMVAEACQAVDAEVDFGDYDWDGDGKVDAVLLLYAGQGENSTSGKDPNTVWPHQSELSQTNYEFQLDGVTIDTYACGPELASRNGIAGIGTLCHEFSHCLGLPDMYDTGGNDNYGMCTWDIMDQGSYNGNGFRPAGYTSYERAYCGWLAPIELAADTEVTDMQPLSENGKAYIIYNDNRKDEYYLLENRQKTGWDTTLDGQGLLVLHVDFDAAVWNVNAVNADPDHQRCTLIHADNSDKVVNKFGFFDAAEVAGDAYPYADNDSLTANSTPKAALFHPNKAGTRLMKGSIKNIKKHDDGTVSFSYQADGSGALPPSSDVKSEVFFHESFDRCRGTGGNDGKFKGLVATQKAQFKPDVTGWHTPNDVAYGGKQCAKFGTSTKVGTVYTPKFNAVGNDTLIFVAAPFDSDGNTLAIYLGDELLGTYLLDKNQWTTIRVPFEGKGQARIRFDPDKRFFLDDVKIVGSRKIATGIVVVEAEKTRPNDGRIYNLNGQYVGTDLATLPRGIYIRNGKKILK